MLYRNANVCYYNGEIFLRRKMPRNLHEHDPERDIRRYILSYIRALRCGDFRVECSHRERSYVRADDLFAGYIDRTSFEGDLYTWICTYTTRPGSSRRGQTFPIPCFSPRMCTPRRSCPRLGPARARRTTGSRRVIRAWCCSWSRVPVSRSSTTTSRRRDCCCSTRRLCVPPDRRESPGARG